MALAVIKLQERVRAATNPHANVARYVLPPALTGADYSAIDKLLEGVHVWHWSNLRAVGGQELELRGALDLTNDLFEFKRTI